MSFKRGRSICDGDGCRVAPEFSVTVYVGTAGNQRTRLKKASRVVRLCKHHTRMLPFQPLPQELRQRIRDVVEVVTGEPCEPGKPKRVK